MDTKITITLDSSLKEEMIKYAVANKQSISSFVSKLINNALQTSRQENTAAKEVRPCCYSMEELSQRVHQGVIDAHQGKGITTDELMKEVEGWQ